MYGNDGYMDEDEIERAVSGDLKKVWQGDGWYQATDGYGEKWEPDFYVTRECLVEVLRGAYEQASIDGTTCVPRIESTPEPSQRRDRAL